MEWKTIFKGLFRFLATNRGLILLYKFNINVRESGYTALATFSFKSDGHLVKLCVLLFWDYNEMLNN